MEMVMDTNSYNVDKVGGVKLGDRVRYTSSAGLMRGEVVDMCLGLNAAGTIVPWIMIQYMDMYAYKRVEICGTEDNLKMMKFRVNFRDKVAA
jgi:hypothetical protein